MRTARLSALTALVLSVTGVLPLAVSAQAAVTDLYVDSGNASCSDTSGSVGSQSAPFCTISAAAAVVQPGQTVHIGKGTYRESVHLTRSGAPGAPITFIGTRPTGWMSGYTSIEGTGHAFALDGVHDVVVDGINVRAGQEAVVVAGSSQVTLNHLDVYSSSWSSDATTSYPGLRVTGQSNGVTVSRSEFNGTHGDAVVIDPGVSHAVITTNFVYSNQGRGVSVTDAPGTAVTSNTIMRGCGPAIELAGSSSGSSIENNVLGEADNTSGPWGACPSANHVDLSVSAASAGGTTADYNIVATTAKSPYTWAGQTYGDVASFQATGRGAHDLPATASQLRGSQDSPVIDSADAKAPGELPTDIFDNPRVDDPNVLNTGTGVGYYDRGAAEVQDRMYAQVSAVPSTVPGHPLDATITGGVFQPWGQTSSSIDFGDGSAPVSSPTFPLTHTYAGPGAYTVTLTATDSTVGTKTATATVTIQPIGAIQPDLTVAANFPQPLHVAAITNGTGSPWPITKSTIDFGDGTVVDAAVSPAQDLHDYAAPGSYTVTDTVTDDHGRTGTTSRTVTVGSDYLPLAPTRILDTRIGLGAETRPVGPGGVVKVKVTGGAGVPADGTVTSVLLNLTATDSTEATHITAFPGTGAVPTASNLNVTPGHDVGNAVVVPVAPDGTISLFNHAGNVDLVADVQGYYTTQPHDAGLRLGYQVAPTRALDTRSGTGGFSSPVGPGGTVRFQVRGPGQLPQDAQVAILNLTATDGTEDSYVTAAPNGTPPTNSSLNFSAGQTVANQVTVPINSDGTVTLYNHTGNVNLIADIQGFYSASAGNSLVTTAPTRVLDTRSGIGGSSQKLGPNSTVKVKVAGVAGLPANVGSVVVNLTATDPTVAGWLNVYPSGSAVRSTSNVNVTPGATVPNLAVVPVGPDGCIEIYNHSGSTNVVVDLQGYTG